jgi:hypothetical protein
VGLHGIWLPFDDDPWNTIAFLVAMTMVSGAVLFIAWSLPLPTQPGQTGWRISCIYVTGGVPVWTVLCCFVVRGPAVCLRFIGACCGLKSRLGSSEPARQTDEAEAGHRDEDASGLAEAQQANESVAPRMSQRKLKSVAPNRWEYVVFVICFLPYLAVRIVLLTLALWSLWDLPSEAHHAVDWHQVIPLPFI